MPPFPYLLPPNTPDLGCFVRRDHEFQLDEPSFHVYFEPPPYDETRNHLPHQVYFRVKCGKSAFFERCHAWIGADWSDVRRLLVSPPDWSIGGDYLPYPSDWLKFPPQRRPHGYFFAGEHRDPARPDWRPNAAVGHIYDIYDNGTVSTVGWDDTGGDRDHNDLVVEVAVVYRGAYFDRPSPFAELSNSVWDTFQRDLLSKYPPGDLGND